VIEVYLPILSRLGTTNPLSGNAFGYRWKKKKILMQQTGVR
jgi:hypothetical protein